MRSILKILVITISLLSVTVGADSIEAQLKRSAEFAAQNLPMMVTEDIQATAILAAGMVLLHRYNFVRPKSELGDIEGMRRDLLADTISASCSNPETLAMLKNGVILQYEFYDLNNEFVTKYAVNAQVCKP